MKDISMATKTKKSSTKKAAAASETTQSIAEQTKAFLKAGGNIQQIDRGVTGQVNIPGPRHITLGNNKPA